jgi:hypothetical protein
MLVIRDSAQPAHVTQGVFVLTVRPPSPPYVARPSRRAIAPSPVPEPEEVPPAPAGQVALWSLSQGDLVALATPPPEAVEAPTPSPEIPANPAPAAPGERSPPAVDLTSFTPTPPLTPEQVGRLRLLVNLEYPTRALFRSAVRDRLGAPARPLPEETVEMVARQAFKPQDLAHAPRPALTALANCGCVPAHPIERARSTYGFLPFWRPIGGAQAVNVSLFDRLEVLGVQLQRDRTWLKPGDRTRTDDDWARDMGRLALTADAHGSRLDLVLQGADWAFLRGQNDADLRQTAHDSARRAMALAADIRPVGLEPIARRLLIPWLWGVRAPRVFDGVTVMFQPPEGPATRAAFDRFYDLFIRELADDINRRGKPFYVNIVATYDPDSQAETLFRPGAFDLKHLVAYSHMQTLNQKPPMSPDEVASYPASSHLFVRILALLPSPTTISKKRLRAEFDALKNAAARPYTVEGAARVTLTNDVIPIVLDPAGAAPVLTPAARAGGALPSAPPGISDAWLAAAQQSQTGSVDGDSLVADLVYLRQNFGGAALWPTPVNTVDAGPYVQEQLARTFFADRTVPFTSVRVSRWAPICWTSLRLALQALVLLLLICPLAYVFADLAPPAQKTFLTAILWLTGVTVLLGFGLLNLDPALAGVRSGNTPFMVTLGLMGAVVWWQYKKPRIRRP